MAAIPASGVLVVDLHGKNEYQARVTLDAALRRSSGLYRIRVSHGHNQGTILRDLIRSSYGDHPRILRMETTRDGWTELVLREF